jgi:hypothetical protein
MTYADRGTPGTIAIDRSGGGPVLHPNGLPSDPQPRRVRPLESLLSAHNSRKCAGNPLRFAVLALLLLPARPAWTAQAVSPKPEPALPEAPQPLIAPVARPCPASSGVKPETGATSAALPGGVPAQPGVQPAAAPCPPKPGINWFERILNGPEVKPLTPLEKARLAGRNVLDPFNAVTILADAGIAVGYNAHSQFGPGMPGFGRYVGVSLTQDMTGEFFGTFLIPSLVHQDPHYHRMPNASIPRRFGHAIAQVAWTQGDNGKGMVNYANLGGYAIDDEIGNLYVPGRQTNLQASAARYSIGLATAPIDNFISEFLPDVARHIHVQIVLIQRVINQVAKTDGPGQP